MERSRWKQQFQGYLEVLSGSVDQFCFIGGTALSLVYLNHRISEDLDFVYLDEASDSENILRTLASAVSGEYEHGETLRSPEGTWFGERWFLIDGESEVKIDVVRNRLVEEPVIETYMDVPVFSVRDLYEGKVRLIARQNDSDPFGLGKGRTRNIRDWIDVYELSLTEKNLGGFLLHDMDVDEQIISGIEEGIRVLHGDELQEELRFLQYKRSVTRDELVHHFEEALDTWHGHQFPAS